MEREPIRIPDKYEREANASARFFIRLDYNGYAIDQYAARGVFMNLLDLRVDLFGISLR